MDMSFSQETKSFLKLLEIKSKCCRNAYESGKNLGISDIIPHFECDFCRNCFMRGIFVSRGSVTNPSKGYHLELSFDNAFHRDEVCEYMTDILGNSGIAPKKTRRKSMFIVYYKNSGAIEDFLVYIGANKAAFEIMNGKIFKEFRNTANRIVNCETANIDKSISASRKHAEVIEELKSAGEFSKLTPELQLTGELRLEYMEASLSELGMKMEPPISKSGVNHRLRKITEHYEEYLENKRDREKKNE